jgi:hypothetical protein
MARANTTVAHGSAIPTTHPAGGPIVRSPIFPSRHKSNDDVVPNRHQLSWKFLYSQSNTKYLLVVNYLLKNASQIHACSLLSSGHTRL